MAPMQTSRGLVPLALVAFVLAACSAAPVSQVSDAPATQAPGSGQPSTAPATATAPPSTPAETAAPTPTPTTAPPSGVPGKPTGTTYRRVSEQPTDGGGVRQTYRVTWKAPEGVATSFLVYGVKDCLRESKANNGKPCLVKGMPVPKDSLALLATAPGAGRSIDISWEVPRSGRVPYPAVLIRAANDAGNSIFTIVHSEDVCWHC